MSPHLSYNIQRKKLKQTDFFFSGEERTIVRTMILVSTIFFHIGNQPPYIRITKKGQYEGSILCDASNLDSRRCVYLPLCNPLTYFESSLGSDLVQKEFAKPMQHEKCPNQKHMKDDR